MGEGGRPVLHRGHLGLERMGVGEQGRVVGRGPYRGGGRLRRVLHPQAEDAPLVDAARTVATSTSRGACVPSSGRRSRQLTNEAFTDFSTLESALDTGQSRAAS